MQNQLPQARSGPLNVPPGSHSSPPWEASGTHPHGVRMATETPGHAKGAGLAFRTPGSQSKTSHAAWGCGDRLGSNVAACDTIKGLAVAQSLADRRQQHAHHGQEHRVAPAALHSRRAVLQTKCCMQCQANMFQCSRGCDLHAKLRQGINQPPTFVRHPTFARDAGPKAPQSATKNRSTQASDPPKLGKLTNQQTKQTTLSYST